MNAKKSILKDILENDNRSFQERLYLFQQLILPASLLLLALISRIAGRKDWISFVALIAMAASGLLVGGLVAHYGRVQFFASLHAALMIAALLPLNFFAREGLYGGTPLWFVLCTLCVSQILTGWRAAALV